MNKSSLDKKKSEKYKEVIKVTEFLYRVFVRHISISKRKVQNIERIIYEFGKDENILKLVEDCKKNIMDDEELQNYMKVMQVKYKEPITYELLCIFELKNQNSTHIKHLYDRSVITVEHILPQTVNSSKAEGQYWIKAAGDLDKCKELCNRLGNLALLDFEKQNQANNKGFDEKKLVYKEQMDIITTSKLCEYIKWEKEEIEKRQGEMAQIFIEEYNLEY